MLERGKGWKEITRGEETRDAGFVSRSSLASQQGTSATSLFQSTSFMSEKDLLSARQDKKGSQSTSFLGYTYIAELLSEVALYKPFLMVRHLSP